MPRTNQKPPDPHTFARGRASLQERCRVDHERREFHRALGYAHGRGRLAKPAFHRDVGGNRYLNDKGREQPA